MKKVRVLHVAQAAGGVDRYLRSLLKYINSDKFENILICSLDYKKSDYTEIVDSFEQVKMVREISLKDDLRAIFKIRKLIKKYNPDIVYAHSSKAGVLARVANMGFENKCIYNPHGWSFNMDCSQKKKRLYATIERICAKLCDQIVCISNAEYRSALNWKICKSSKLSVIFNGIDLDKYKSTKPQQINREDIGIPKDAFVIGMVGRISEQKAPDIFIKAANLIKEKLPKAYFVIVGDGELRSEIEKYAQINDLSTSLLITGWVENPMDYIQIFDVATLLSRWEGFGLVLPEYMLAKKPIVATNVDAIPDIISNEKNGLLVNHDDPKAVCQKVIEISRNQELNQSLITNGYNKVNSKFDVKRVAKEHEKLFFNILGVRRNL